MTDASAPEPTRRGREERLAGLRLFRPPRASASRRCGPAGSRTRGISSKRLRARVTGVCVVVGRWGVTVGPLEDPAPLVAAGADRVATTLAATRDHILELMPLLAAPEAPQPLRRSA